MAGAITAIPGASVVLDRGFVTYSNAAKTELLGVPAGLIDAVGAVSEPVARRMAAGARRQANADLAVSVTGIAGPAAAMPPNRLAPSGSALASPAGRIACPA